MATINDYASVQEFMSRPLKSVTNYDTETGKPNYTVSIVNGKIVVDNKEYAEMLARRRVYVNHVMYGIDSPQEWLHGLIIEAGSYSNYSFEFAE